VIGRNGAGKSTLLRLLAGILGPDRGRIERGRRRCARRCSASRSASCPSSPDARMPTLSGNAARSRTRRKSAARMESIIAFSDARERDRRSDHDVVGRAMRARLGFSVAYHADPDVLPARRGARHRRRGIPRKNRPPRCGAERIRSDRTCVLVSHDARGNCRALRPLHLGRRGTHRRDRIRTPRARGIYSLEHAFVPAAATDRRKSLSRNAWGQASNAQAERSVA